MGTVGARVTVLIADADRTYREGMAQAIKERPDLHLIAECSDGNQALAEIEAGRPDVVLLDLAMPGVDGMQLLASLPTLANRPHALVLSGHADGSHVYEALSRGAAGYLRKDSNRQRVCDAIAAVARGETALGPELAAGLAEQIRSRRPDPGPRLTDREREILRLTAEGRSRLEIAEGLHLSPATVKTHLKHVYEKLGVSDRAAAVAVALRAGVFR